MTELDPVAIRKCLVAHREKGSPWALAWPAATNHYHVERTDYRSPYGFMERHFRAAYFNTSTPLGRWRVAGRDLSSALMESSTAVVQTDHKRCQSGDGCDRDAVRGRFGRMWCDHHATELERLAVKLAEARSRADPRNNGNKTLFTHRAA